MHIIFFYIFLSVNVFYAPTHLKYWVTENMRPNGLYIYFSDTAATLLPSFVACDCSNLLF